MKLLTFLFVFFLSSPLHANSLTPIEKKIHNLVIEQSVQQLRLLEKLVNINSGTENIAGVRQVGEILKQQFEQLGFKTQWVEEPINMHKAPTLIAEYNGGKGKRILLIGHLDTVFPSSSRFQKFIRHGNEGKGPGIIDDKGGDVVMLYALKALYAAHALDNMTITVVLTGDEEDAGKPTSISRIPLISIAKHSDVALDFEAAITLNTATIARRGIMNWTLSTQGNESHSSEIFQKHIGYGAIFELNRILNMIRIKFYREKYLTFNPGILLGGTKINYDKEHAQGNAFGKQNVIAKIALAKGDIRFLTQKEKNRIKQSVLSIVNNHLPNTNATITFQDGIPSMPPTHANLALLKKYSKVSIDLGYGSIKPLDPGLRGAGDISHVAAFTRANLAGLGPTGWGSHSEKETLKINSLSIQTQRAALLIYRLTHTVH